MGAEGPRDHGPPTGRQAPLERDALPRRAPHVPRAHRCHEPAWPLPRVAEGPRRMRGDPGGGPLEERRRGDHHGAAPAQALHGPEVAEVIGAPLPRTLTDTSLW